MLLQTDDTTADATKFFDKINTYLSVEDRLRVKKAYELARREHGEQRRKTGELFFTHPLTVAYYLSEYHLDASALEAALLHDIAEDTRVSIAEIETDFSAEVARLVDGVTKLKDVTEGVAKGKRLPPEELQDKTLHKLFSAMTEDVRTVIIKLFDRLHNMRTIKGLPLYKQKQKAQETLAVYAPLANRLGLWNLKNELESLSLEVLYNNAYTTIKRRREEMERAQQEMFHLLSGQIFSCLLQAEIDVRNVVLAPENIYTIFQDLTASGASYDDIDRTIRLVVLVNEWTDCYMALGHLHQLWRPVPGTFDDYIAVPRDNLYRSLHTTLVHSHGQQVKLRIRTVAMDKVSEIGVLARWLYAGTPLWSKGIADRIESFFENINDNINVEPQNPGAGVKGVVEDVFRKQIRVYTPRGEIVELGQGATIIDFAYAIHTGLGNQTHAAYVNDTYFPLNKPLKDGDQVRIVKKARAQPQRAWLDDDLGYITTNYARSHARRWFRRLSTHRAILEGQDLVQTELGILGYPDFSHQEIAEAFGYEETQQLYYAVGRAEVLPTAVANRVLEYKWGTGPARSLDVMVQTGDDEEVVITKSPTRRLRLCGTCQPRPPHQIEGFMRKDGGITVHRNRCHLLRAERGRIVKLGWSETTREAHEVTVQVDVYDRPGLLFEISQLMEDEQINISYIYTPPRRGGELQIILTLEVLQPRQLVRILHQIHALPNVFDLRCLPGGPPEAPRNGAAPLYLPE
jgi:GTP diphosphokinase / guanosine-3',5'-bis(diphosphate) 3'-diphosphatase